MILFPTISPDIFSITVFGAEFTLRWYAVSYIIGFIFALQIMKFFARRSYLWPSQKPPMKIDDCDALLTYLILGVILGGRLGYVLFYNFQFYMENPSSILRVWDGGMAFHGGFIGVVIAATIFCFKNKISVMSAADLVAVATPPGLLFGRIANFVNAELWGRPTNMPWGIVFPGNSAQDCPGVIGFCARHPTQLYEAALEGLLLFIILFFLSLRGGLAIKGLMTGLFISLYGIARFIVEFYRMPDPQFFSENNLQGFAYSFGELGVTMGQVLSLPMIAVGGLLVLFSFYREAKHN